MRLPHGAGSDEEIGQALDAYEQLTQAAKPNKTKIKGAMDRLRQLGVSDAGNALRARRAEAVAAPGERASEEEIQAALTEHKQLRADDFHSGTMVFAEGKTFPDAKKPTPKQLAASEARVRSLGVPDDELRARYQALPDVTPTPVDEAAKKPMRKLT